MNFSEILTAAITKFGKQEALASELGLSNDALSKRINGTYGWQGDEVNKLLDLVSADIVFKREFSEKIKILKSAMKILLNESD